MEINRDQFEKLTVVAQQEQKQKVSKVKENASKWDLLNRRLGIEAAPS